MGVVANETQSLVVCDVKNGEQRSGADVGHDIPLGIDQRDILSYISGVFPYGGTERYAKPRNRYGRDPKRLTTPIDSSVRIFLLTF